MEIKKRNRRSKDIIIKEKIEKAKKLLEQQKTTTSLPVESFSNNTVDGVSGVSDTFKPLPLFSSEGGESNASNTDIDKKGSQSSVVVDIEKDKLLKEGLAELVSEDVPRFFENGLILLGWDERAVVNPPSKARAALWSEFALPMLRKFFPDFDADMMFWVLTASLFGSMITIKKQKEIKNANTKD